MRSLKNACIAAFIALGFGCGDSGNGQLPPLGQLLVYVDTDAPLGGSPDEAALFDRVRIDVYRPEETEPCEGCAHEFDIDATVVRSGRASVGITTPPHATGYIARVRLYRAAFTEGGEPRADGVIDVTVALPATEDEGITPVTVFLPTDAVARPIGTLAVPAAPEQGAPPFPSRVGTWAHARSVPCPGAPKPGEACVPGGAFWMGQPQLRGHFAAFDPPLVRLAVVSPFFIDTHEVLVPAFRSANVQDAIDPIRASGNASQLRCTFTETPGPNEALPVNCIGWDTARRYCQKQGGDLPTEAQFQLVASARRGALFPWGDAPPRCGDAVFATAPFAVLPEDRCPGDWVMPPRSGLRDRISFGGEEIVDLAGNLFEHARDYFNLNKSKCWGTGVFIDPICNIPWKDVTAFETRTLRGGSHVGSALALAAAARGPGFDFMETRNVARVRDEAAWLLSGVGFRCMRPAE